MILIMMMMMTGATYQQALPSHWGPVPPGVQAPGEFKYEDEDDEDDEDQEEEEEEDDDLRLQAS